MRTFVLLSLAALMGAVIIVGCGDAEREARLAQMSPQERFVQDVLDRRCVKCHTPPNPTGKAVLTEPKHLIPMITGDVLLDDLALYNNIMGGPNIPEHNREEYKPTPAEIDSIRSWALTEYRDRFPEAQM